MTKLKVSSKFRLFLIISIALIVIGMVMGTVGHFALNGFFNYGEEFSSYKSVVVRYSAAEYTEEQVKDIGKEVLSSSKGGYSVSYSEALRGGEIVYKFSPTADDDALLAIANQITDKLNEGNEGDMAKLNVASVRTATVEAGGSRALVFASIATASATAFVFLYYIFRYKLRSACTAFIACAHNLGLFVALAALTRIPVGAEFIALSALVVFITALGCGVLFGKTRNNFKSDAYSKTDRAEVVDISAAESHKINMTVILALAVIGVVFGVFAAIASLQLTALFVVLTVIIAALACCYGTIYFAPSVYAKIDALCEKIIAARKEKKADGKNQTAVSDKAQA